jgi:hypothetical protein
MALRRRVGSKDGLDIETISNNSALNSGDF